jgi:two-component system nitrate/nitrite sensor histidine kinase NarX
VSDDGIGIRGPGGTHHYGLTIMEERAKHLGGELVVENLPARGTRVRLHFMPGPRHDAVAAVQPVQPN